MSHSRKLVSLTGILLSMGMFYLQTTTQLDAIEIAEVAVGYDAMKGDYLFPMKVVAGKEEDEGRYLEPFSASEFMLQNGEGDINGAFSIRKNILYFTSLEGLTIRVGKFKGQPQPGYRSGWSIIAVDFEPEVTGLVRSPTQVGNGYDYRLKLNEPIATIEEKQKAEPIPIEAQEEPPKPFSDLHWLDKLEHLKSKFFALDYAETKVMTRVRAKSKFKNFRLRFINSVEGRYAKVLLVLNNSSKEGTMDLREAVAFEGASGGILFKWMEDQEEVEYLVKVSKNNPETAEVILRTPPKRLIFNRKKPYEVVRNLIFTCTDSLTELK